MLHANQLGILLQNAAAATGLAPEIVYELSITVTLEMEILAF